MIPTRLPAGVPTIDDALGPLAESLRSAPDPAVRAFSALTLGQCGRLEAVAPLIAALEDPEKVVRRSAVQALVGVGTAGVPALIGALDHPSWVVRYRAAEALGGIRDPRNPPALVRLLEDPRDHVRYMAAKGLIIQPDAAAVEPLRLRLHDENPFVRRMAARALRESGAPLAPADEALIERLDPRT